MGMDAELLAIGPFSKQIVGNLEYPADFYEDTPVGSLIITCVCCCNNTDGSKLLAEALRIHPWKFEEHCNIDGQDVSLVLMADVIENPDDIVDFVALHEAGFKFYYRPNG